MDSLNLCDGAAGAGAAGGGSGVYLFRETALKAGESSRVESVSVLSCPGFNQRGKGREDDDGEEEDGDDDDNRTHPTSVVMHLQISTRVSVGFFSS